MLDNDQKIVYNMGWRGGISLRLDLSEFVVVVSRETLNVSRETLTVDN